MNSWLTTFELRHWLLAGVGLLLLVGLGVFLVPGADSETSSAPDASASEAPASIVMEVNGMSCSACATSVQRSLSDLGGVEEVEVNLEENQAKIWAAESATLDDKTLRTTIEEAGYDSGSIERLEGHDSG